MLDVRDNSTINIAKEHGFKVNSLHLYNSNISFRWIFLMKIHLKEKQEKFFL